MAPHIFRLHIFILYSEKYSIHVPCPRRLLLSVSCLSHVLVRSIRVPLLAQNNLYLLRNISFKMHYLLAVLLSLLSLFRVCSSTLNETLSDGEYLEKHLVRRAASATTLFAFLDPGQKGSCTSDQQTKISAWIADATELHNAITSAVNVGIGKQDAVHLRVFLGIAVTPDGPQPGPDKANWDDVKGEWSPSNWALARSLY